MIGLLALVLGFIRIRQEELSTHTIIFAALMLALAIILQQLRIFHMPQGGSVTAGSMVPLLLIAYRFGPGIGMLTGFLYGMINLLQDPFVLHPVQVLFDYPLPFMAMGLAGLSPHHRFLGTAAAFFGRFACHFLSGVVFFGSYAPAGTSVYLYSFLFNITYLVPEFLICCLILKLLPVKRLVSAMEAS
ncbi:energy-coupled thiamine transporter ThiT [Selenomonas ruminis]|uniref:Energy-coupled thiamine transporter ThiT n=1 Tax=Selenomonas ruminis TaxID=2593411 RepID=A0A5D6W2G6_9FIRM|nr:energy-coupled thiamine transporter ThiT [Selenomonas sp.]TYZ22641.1 energy-coupled thiamine transporter ThiT [Selenomonas sp. mPRGC5]